LGRPLTWPGRLHFFCFFERLIFLFTFCFPSALRLEISPVAFWSLAWYGSGTYHGRTGTVAGVRRWTNATRASNRRTPKDNPGRCGIVSPPPLRLLLPSCGHGSLH
jgi:hypothetical protein